MDLPSLCENLPSRCEGDEEGSTRDKMDTHQGKGMAGQTNLLSREEKGLNERKEDICLTSEEWVIFCNWERSLLRAQLWRWDGEYSFGHTGPVAAGKHPKCCDEALPERGENNQDQWQIRAEQMRWKSNTWRWPSVYETLFVKSWKKGRPVVEVTNRTGECCT